MGVVTPLVVGAAALAFGADSQVLAVFIAAAAIIGLVQLVLSTWSIVARWDERYEYAVESIRDNTKIYNDFKRLNAENISDSDAKVKIALEAYQRREFSDISKNITDKEKRFAARESYKYFKKPCHICNEVPKSSKPGKCEGCGKF
jgi:mobilome CxxCx(11)CxxC protein